MQPVRPETDVGIEKSEIDVRLRGPKQPRR